VSAGVATIEAMPDPAAREAEFVERKGLGHPDTTCDAIAEEVSRALSAAYLGRFGRILHHNVDKVLLVAGSSAPRFGGGRILEPIRVVLAGRATARIGDEAIDVPGIALEAARACIRARFRFLDPLRDMAFECRIREGSADLRALFARGHRVPLANDSSAGAGFAPFSPLERLVAGCERALNAPGTRPHPGRGWPSPAPASPRCSTARPPTATRWTRRHASRATSPRARPRSRSRRSGSTPRTSRGTDPST
jgi:S-adenosylmethionine synthetase